MMFNIQNKNAQTNYQQNLSIYFNDYKSMTLEVSIFTLYFQFYLRFFQYIIFLFRELTLMGKKQKTKNKNQLEIEKNQLDQGADSDYVTPKKKGIRKNQPSKSSRATKKKEEKNGSEDLSQEYSKSDNEHSLKQESKPENKTNLQILEELKKALLDLQNIVKKSENELRSHQIACATLHTKINQRKESIRQIKEQIHHTEKSLIEKSVGTDTILFYNSSTFKYQDTFQRFYHNLKELPQKISACIFQSSKISLQFQKLNQESISKLLGSLDQNSSQKKLIEEHFKSFPFIACPLNQVDLIKAFICEKEAHQDPKKSILLRQITALFVRSSTFSKKIILSSANYVYDQIFNDQTQTIINILCELIQNKLSLVHIEKKQVEESISNALSSGHFISIPETQRQIRGFCYNQKIYINTYYMQENNSYPYEIKLVYSIFVWLREIANFVFQDFYTKRNQQKKQLSEILQEGLKRQDFGVEFEKMLTGGQGFIGACQDFMVTLKNHPVNFRNLGVIDTTSTISYIFKEFQQLNRKKLNSISELYLGVNLNEGMIAQDEIQEKGEIEQLAQKN